MAHKLGKEAGFGHKTFRVGKECKLGMTAHIKDYFITSHPPPTLQAVGGMKGIEANIETRHGFFRDNVGSWYWRHQRR